jgi:uncharacterized protein DUF6364
MSKARKRRTSAAASQARPATRGAGKKRATKQAKRPTNLTLDPDAVRRGELFGQRHGRSLSQLVTGFLYSLPAEDAGEALPELAPAVRRLFGLAAGAKTDRDSYREHLAQKYGGP